jgi:hypothetical protein
MKGFLLFLALAMAFGIYQGVPSERIENTIRSGIAQFQIRDIPFFGRFAQPLLSMEEGDFLGPLVDRFAQPQIAAQCQGDERCEELIKQSLREELQKSLASGSESPENMAVEQEVKGFLSKQFDAFREKVNLGVAAAGIFLLIFLPFIGIFGWVLSLICYMFFLLLRLAGFFHVVEHSTVQKRIE